ncbi:MAG: GntR family transcriptional regulator [Pseudomonadales bacterium]|nr:GntR family transcriptional regulator [Pseudomonadales bacterium]NIX08453.1 GntR family transcriptional regulator [Pseudomonadales bacterium]
MASRANNYAEQQGFAPAISLTEQIAEHLAREIITGRLCANARIQELRVADDLGVSRGSVREALLILESRHLIDLLPRRGAIVRDLKGDELMSFSELFTDLAAAFFCKLAREPDVDLGVASQAVDAMATALHRSDLEGSIAARQAFVDGCFAELNDVYLVSVLRALLPSALRLAHQAAGNAAYEMRDTVRFHHALLEALSRRDEHRVGELVRAFGRREGQLAAERRTP